MAAYLMCVTVSGGVPIFNRKFGDIKSVSETNIHTGWGISVMTVGLRKNKPERVSASKCDVENWKTLGIF